MAYDYTGHHRDFLRLALADGGYVPADPRSPRRAYTWVLNTSTALVEMGMIVRQRVPGTSRVAYVVTSQGRQYLHDLEDGVLHDPARWQSHHATWAYEAGLTQLAIPYMCSNPGAHLDLLRSDGSAPASAALFLHDVYGVHAAPALAGEEGAKDIVIGLRVTEYTQAALQYVIQRTGRPSQMDAIAYCIQVVARLLAHADTEAMAGES